MIIAEELESAEEFLFERIQTNDPDSPELVVLSRRNVALAEAMIKNDSAYMKSFDKNAKPINGPKGKIKYGGSTAFWMTQLKELLVVQEQKTEYSYESIIEGAVSAVDRENSTHLNADSVGRNEIIERIQTEIEPAYFIGALRDPTNTKLFDIISRRTSAKKKARVNVSFASKFCHFACFYLFEGEDAQDNYSIYDSILKKVIPHYLSYYEINEKYDLTNYYSYRRAIDAIRSRVDPKISRNGLDHLLWYYYKGRLI